MMQLGGFERIMDLLLWSADCFSDAAALRLREGLFDLPPPLPESSLVIKISPILERPALPPTSTLIFSQSDYPSAPLPLPPRAIAEGSMQLRAIFDILLSIAAGNVSVNTHVSEGIASNNAVHLRVASLQKMLIAVCSFTEWCSARCWTSSATMCVRAPATRASAARRVALLASGVFCSSFPSTFFFLKHFFLFRSILTWSTQIMSHTPELQLLVLEFAGRIVQALPSALEWWPQCRAWEVFTNAYFLPPEDSTLPLPFQLALRIQLLALLQFIGCMRGTSPSPRRESVCMYEWRLTLTAGHDPLLELQTLLGLWDRLRDDPDALLAISEAIQRILVGNLVLGPLPPLCYLLFGH